VRVVEVRDSYVFEARMQVPDCTFQVAFLGRGHGSRHPDQGAQGAPADCAGCFGSDGVAGAGSGKLTPSPGLRGLDQFPGCNQGFECSFQLLSPRL
jgi:hypothetical protein